MDRKINRGYTIPPRGFTERLYEAYQRSAYSITQLSRLTGIARPCLYDYIIYGAKAPTISAVARLSSVLHVSIDWLVFGTER